MYTAAVRGIEMLKEYDLSKYTPAIILLTDGQSGGSLYDFEDAYEELGTEVPVFSIMFGDADETQLEELALKARFSQHALTQEELEPFLEELDKALSLLRERLPKGRLLWCRYGLCLF